MSGKTTNPLSKYFGEMEKKPLRKGELNHIFDQLAERTSGEVRPAPAKKEEQVITSKEHVAAH